MITTLRASPFAATPAGPLPSLFGRIGLSLLEFALGDGDEESSRLGRIRIAKTELAQARAGRATHVQVAVSIRSLGRAKQALRSSTGSAAASAVLLLSSAIDGW